MGGSQQRYKERVGGFFWLVRPLARLCSEGGVCFGGSHPPHLSLPSLSSDGLPPRSSLPQTHCQTRGRAALWGLGFFNDISKIIRM